MKAEQRKELETNTLADRMGRVMQRVKESPRRTFMTYLIVGAALAVAGWLGYHWYQGTKVETSEQWVKFYDGGEAPIHQLAQDATVYSGKAARFQVAWSWYWDEGVKRIGTDREGALMKIKGAADLYTKLIEDCKDDTNPILELQAMLGRAVATETLAVQNREHLKTAKNYYGEIVEKYDVEKYAEAKYAKQRHDILKDAAKEQALSKTYQELQELLKIPAVIQPKAAPIGIDKKK